MNRISSFRKNYPRFSLGILGIVGHYVCAGVVWVELLYGCGLGWSFMYGCGLQGP